jgi:excisionase family DNA binding protein
MNRMSLTEQQACKLLQVTPATLNLYVANRRLSVNRTRTIRGLMVSYDETELKALRRELQEDEEYVRKRFGQAKSSSKTVEAELVDVEVDATDAKGTNSSVPASVPVIERLLLLLESLTPSDHPKVAIEKKLLLTLAEAAVYSGLSEVKLNEAIRAGKLTARKDLGRGYRVKRSDIESYIKSL